MEGENSTGGPQPYQPYEAEVTNSPISNNPNAKAAAKKEYASAINHWKAKNERACGMINFSIEQGPRIHVGNIEITMWAIRTVESYYSYYSTPGN